MATDTAAGAREQRTSPLGLCFLTGLVRLERDIDIYLALWFDHYAKGYVRHCPNLREPTRRR
jgi:hypothetical protein